MTESLKFLGIAGSLRRASFNRAALQAAQHLLPADVTLEIFDLEGVPLFNQDHESEPAPAVIRLKQKIREADAILIATPEYNYSIPGVLKNAIDAASRPYGESAWAGKPVAVMGASPGQFGSARAQYHLRLCFITLNMPCVNQPEVMISHADKAFAADGSLTDPKSQQLLGQLLENLATLTRQLKLSKNND